MKTAIIVGVIVIGVFVGGGFFLLCMAAGHFDDRKIGGTENEKEEERK